MRMKLPPAPQVLIFFVVIVCMSSCATRRKQANVLQKKWAPQQLQAEVALLEKILEANHPSLYLFTPKDSMDLLFRELRAGITDSLTLAQYRNRLAVVISNIRCGHTAIRFPDSYTEAVLKQKNNPRFPLSIKTWGDSLVVMSNLIRKDSTIKRGTIITAINGFSPKQLIDSMSRFIGSDGYAFNFKSQLITFNFGAHYQNAFGTDSTYLISYIDDNGIARETVLPNFVVRPDSSAKMRPTIPQPPPLTRKEIRKAALANKRSMYIDTALNAGFMRVATFSSGQLRRFFRQSFRQLAKDSVGSLVIDLRENGGGNIGVSNRFIRYLTDHHFKVADSVFAQSRSLKYGRYIHPKWPYWITMQFTSRKRADGNYHFGFYERHAFKPGKRHHFNGHVYILHGGFTFSAASMVVSHLKGQKNVITAGEETGGGSFGNNSVHLPMIKLPYTGMQVVLPLYRIVLDASGYEKGEGIQPNLPIPPSSAAIRAGLDIKTETIKMLLKTNPDPVPPSPPHNPL